MLYNLNFAKLLSETQLEYAPKNVCFEDTWYCPASDDMLRRMGYKKVINTPYPEDGKSYVYYWRETSNNIKKYWEAQPDPEPLTPSQEREYAYETELICKYGNGVYTVDEMNDLWFKYSAEGATEKVQEIQEIIVAAKEEIRKKYPDK